MSLRIFAEFDGEVYRLMCDDGRTRPEPCGARIFRGPPHPNVKFSHETMESAQADADKISAYLGGLKDRKISKAKLREHVA